MIIYKVGDWLPIFGVRNFWYHFLDLDEVRDLPHFPELQECSYEFEIAAECALVMEFDDSLCTVTLNLRHAQAEKLISIGETGPHGVPFVLRWAEAQAICECLARRDPRVQHPGTALLLLFEFVLLGADDDHAVVRTTLDMAWRSLEIFGDQEIVHLIDHQLAVTQQGKYSHGWIEDSAYGWVPDGDVLSMRQPGYDAFPFVYFHDLLDQASRGAGRTPPPTSPQRISLPDIGKSTKEEREAARSLLQQARNLGKVIELTLDPDDRIEAVKSLFGTSAHELGYTIRFLPVSRRNPGDTTGLTRDVFTVTVLPDN